MDVFRIALARYATGLVSSGRPARWNSKDMRAIYAAGSRSLACLESLAHRRGTEGSEDYRVIVIEVPDELAIEELHPSDLPADWRSLIDLRPCQRIGDAWLGAQRTTLLRVPSVIIPEEHNYVINPQHPDFKALRVREVLPFPFDRRLAGG